MKLAIIGLGLRMGGLLKHSFRSEIPGLQVVGVLDPDESSARKHLTPEEQTSVVFCKTVPELIKKCRPDAVAIGTRCNLHTPFAIQVLREGLPLYLEKPVATSMKQALELDQAMTKSRSETVVSFPLRLSPLCEHAKKLLQQGVIGEPEHLNGINYVPYGKVYFDSWYRDYNITQGLFLQKATHDLDYISYLAGASITRVGAMLSRGRIYKDSSLKKSSTDSSALFFEKIGTPETGMNEDSSSTLLEFSNGAQGVYTQVFYTRRDAAARGVTISGRLGTLSFDWCKSQLKLVRHYEPISDLATLDSSVEHYGGDAILAKNFGEVVRNGAKSLAPLSAGLQSVYACLAARDSALKGRFMEVRQVGGENRKHKKS